jgi:16S rRNA (uracil1498-N3)-methyltransferase
MPDLDATAPQAELPEAEGHHLAHVMRLGVGAEIRVFDGRGRERAARVALIERRRVIVDLLDAVEPAGESRVRLVLAQAVLKPEAMDRVVRDAVMLGAAALVPILTSRVTVPLREGRAAQVQERWRRIAVASAKQCGRAVVPPVAAPVAFSRWLPGAASQGPGGSPAAVDASGGVKVVLAEPARGGAPRLDLASLAPRAMAGGALVAIGPEGGWAPEELAALDAHGFLRWSLGQRTLRAVTAPTAALSILLYAWD